MMAVVVIVSLILVAALGAWLLTRTKVYRAQRGRSGGWSGRKAVLDAQDQVTNRELGIHEGPDWYQP